MTGQQEFLNSTSHNVEWFQLQNTLERPTIQPPFQRRAVWLGPEKSWLIDTILRQYPIPELYLQQLITDAGTTEHIVVDGQQRITTCLEYLANDFEIRIDPPALGTGSALLI